MKLEYALIASGIVSLIAFIGILVVPKQWQHSLEQRLLGFAAGVLLAAGILLILPEAVEHSSGSTPYYALLSGIIGFFILEHLFRGFHAHRHDNEENQAPGYLVVMGDSLHNFIDGIAIGVAFQVDPTLGVGATIAIVAHEVPHEIANFVILLKSGFSRKRAILLNFLSALTSVFGVILCFIFGNFLESYQGVLLAVTTGNFLYIGAVDIIPELSHDHGKAKYMLPLIGGVVIMLAVKIFLPEH